MYRKTYAKIDGKILENNVKEIKKKYNQYQYYFGVVKNNAYGHGMHVVKNLVKGGINYLAVSSLEEALQVRKYTRTTPILVLEPIDLEYIDDAINNNITLTVESLSYLKQLIELPLSYEVKIHLKLDTGMNRLGLKEEKEVVKALTLIKENKKLILEGIYSHFATSGKKDKYYDQQMNRFKTLTASIDLTKIPIVHLDRSATFVSHEKLDFVNGVRLGIVLYGFNNSLKPDTSLKGKLRTIKENWYRKKNHLSLSFYENDLQVHTAFSLYTTVMSLRPVKKGEVVGYTTKVIEQDGWIATLPIGYADGITKEFGYVSIHQKKYPILADTMDMIMVFVDEKVKLKDQVELFGNTISIREVCQRLNTNSYHLFNQITSRVVRVHVDAQDEVEIKY